MAEIHDEVSPNNRQNQDYQKSKYLFNQLLFSIIHPMNTPHALKIMSTVYE